MDKLRGVDSLPVVLHRFSNGVEVVKCVVDFCNEVALLERSYSESLHRLLRSSSYTFHSNLLFQWLGNEPYKEIGSLKHSWQELGQELCKLADLHSEQAEEYQNTVRKPLTELLPHLEEARRNFRVKMQQLKGSLDLPFKKMNKERQKYVGLGESCERLQNQIRDMSTGGSPSRAKLRRFEKKLDSMEKQLFDQEQVYHTSHGHYLQSLKQCEEEIQELYKRHHEREIERVNTLKVALLSFTKVLSNTAPAYLEGMQRIYISVDKIDGASDIDCFINEHSEFQGTPQPPELEKHCFVRDAPKDISENEGGRQSPLGSTGDEEEEEEERVLELDQGRNSTEKPLPASTDESVPSSSSRGGLPGTVPNALAKVTGIRKTKQERVDVEDEVEEMTSKTQKSVRERRLWPLEGWWEGIKERLRPTESREERGGKDEGGVKEAVAEDEGEGERKREGEGEGERVTGRWGGGKGGGDAQYKKNSELTLNVPKEREDTKKEASSEKRNKPSKHPHPHHVSSLVYKIENSGETERNHERLQPSPRRRMRGGPISRGPTKPSPNPKPAILKTQPDGSRGGSSNGVSSKSSSSMTLSSSDKVQRPLQATQPRITAQSQATDQAGSAHTKRTNQSQRTTHKPQTAHRTGATGHYTTSTDNLPNLPVFAAHSDAKSHLSAPTATLHLPTNVKVDTSHVSDPNISHLLGKLQQHAVENDYYRMFRVDSSASSEDISRVRRERSRQLHPDHFANQPEKQERAQQQLMLINQVFQDVLKSTETRALYDQLCLFRKNYGRIPDQKRRGLEVAQCKLESLHKQLKKHRAPLALLTELQTALDLITACLESAPSHKH